jgi:RNA polymerase sigma-70 factor (ECF subfamily)
MAIAPSAAPAGNDEDATLVRRIAAGDRTAFEQMMRRHNRRLYRLARAALRDDAEAEARCRRRIWRRTARSRGSAARRRSRPGFHAWC